MIPDHLIDKAARAMHADDLLEGEHEKFEDSPPWYQAIAERRARAALEAVAADIWHEGYAAAEWNAEEVCKCAAWNEGECGCGNYGNGHRIKRNPYKEAA